LRRGGEKRTREAEHKHTKEKRGKLGKSERISIGGKNGARVSKGQARRKLVKGEKGKVQANRR